MSVQVPVFVSVSDASGPELDKARDLSLRVGRDNVQVQAVLDATRYFHLKCTKIRPKFLESFSTR